MARTRTRRERRTRRTGSSDWTGNHYGQLPSDANVFRSGSRSVTRKADHRAISGRRRGGRKD